MTVNASTTDRDRAYEQLVAAVKDRFGDQCASIGIGLVRRGNVMAKYVPEYDLYRLDVVERDGVVRRYDIWLSRHQDVRTRILGHATSKYVSASAADIELLTQTVESIADYAAERIMEDR